MMPSAAPARAPAPAPSSPAPPSTSGPLSSAPPKPKLGVGARAAAASALATKRLQRVERAIPVFLDLAEDRVRFRGLNVALFSLVILYVVRAAIFVVFLSFPLNLAAAPARTMDPYADSSVQLGHAFASPVRVHVGTTAGRASPGRSLTLRVELATPELMLFLPTNGFADTTLDLAGVPVGGRYSLPGFVPKALQRPVVVGATEVTDASGYARFRKLRIVAGVPGTYVVTVVDDGDGLERLVGKVQVTSSVASATILEDGSPRLRFGRRGRAPRVAPGGALPRIAVQVRDGSGGAVRDATCVLVSAPLSAQEFSGVGSRPDVFHPRLAVVAGAVSAPSDVDGVAVFANATLVASSLRHVRLAAVCDGLVATHPGGADGSMIFAARRADDEAAELVATVFTQPSASALEGAVLAQQPAVLLQLRDRASGALRPAVGAIAFAFPLMQNGFRSRNIMAPEGAAELGLLGGAVAKNVGRVKHLFRAVSAPADAGGVVRFTGLGFIRHGPAGNYSLGFASAGVIVGAESQPINVLSSVASVQWLSAPLMDDMFVRTLAEARGLACNVSKTCGSCSGPRHSASCYPALPLNRSTGSPFQQPPSRVASVVCNWPACISDWGSALGFPIVDTSVTLHQSRVDGNNFEFRAGPSGIFSSAPMLVITDALGRPLAGKSMTPVVFAESGTVEVVEIPHKGATVSKLDSDLSTVLQADSICTLFGLDPAECSNPVTSPSFLPPSGALVLHSDNLAIDNAASDLLVLIRDILSSDTQDLFWSLADRVKFTEEVQASRDRGSFLRVVTSPPGTTVATIAFDVEGVRSGTSTLHVDNVDNNRLSPKVPSWAPPASATCAHIRILKAPALIRQGLEPSVGLPGVETMTLRFLDASGQPSDFVVQAVNSFGEPVHVDGIGMYAVDALGYVMSTSVGGDHVALTSSYTDTLRPLGAASLAMGNYSAMTLFRERLHAPETLHNTNASGFATFNETRIRRSQNTWVRYAFVALNANSTARWLGFPTSVSELNLGNGRDLGANLDGLSISEFYDGPSPCVSEYSSPIAIDSAVGSVTWVASAPAKASALLNASTSNKIAQLSTLPPIKITSSAWASQQLSTASSFPHATLFGATDNAFSTIPAHIGVTAASFGVTDLQHSVESWSRKLQDISNLHFPNLQLPQLNLIPAHNETTYFEEETSQVAAVAGTSSMLGLGLARWPFFESGRLVYGRPLSAPVQSSFSPSTYASSVEAMFPTLFSSFGNVGDFEFFAIAGGVTSDEAVQVSYDDNINVVLVLDYLNGTSVCPSEHPLHNLWDNSFSSIPAHEPDLFCEPENTASRLCDVCVCKAGFDGAEDCSLPYKGDRMNEFFSGSKQYKDIFGGLPVYDSGAAIVRLRRTYDSSLPFNFDIFPRVLMAARIIPGWAPPELPAVLKNVSKTLPSMPAFETYAGVPRSDQLNDIANIAILHNSKLTSVNNPLVATTFNGVAGGRHSPALNVTPARGPGYRAFPILYTCTGQPVRGWFFAPAWSGCASDQVTVYADFTDDPGSFLLNFDHYKRSITFDMDSNNLFFAQTVEEDRRLYLGGVPTGCYRFKYAYAPQGAGSRELRHIEDLTEAQAVSLGASRPFRVLGVVDHIDTPIYSSFTDPGSGPIRIARDAPLDPFTVNVYARTLLDDLNHELTDICSSVPTDFNSWRSATRPSTGTGSPRCDSKAIPEQGNKFLDVTVSAVSLDTSIEYSLYVPTKSFDCTRALYTDTGDDKWMYAAEFTDIRFPTSPALPPGAAGLVSAAVAANIPAGTYVLRFTAYGEHIDSDELFQLVDDPTHLAMVRNNSITASEAQPTTNDLRDFVSIYFERSIQIAVSFSVSPAFLDCASGLCLTFSDLNQIYACASSCTAAKAIERAPSILVHASVLRSPAIGGKARLSLSQQLVAAWPPELSRSLFQTLQFGCIVANSPVTQLLSFAGSDSDTNVVVGALVESEVIYGPPRNNVKITGSSHFTERQRTGSDVVSEGKSSAWADFSSLSFASGASGLYVVRFSVSGGAAPAYVPILVTNAVPRVDVSFGGQGLAAPALGAPYSALPAAARVVEASFVSSVVRVCVPGSPTRPAAYWADEVLTVRLLRDVPVAASAGPEVVPGAVPPAPEGEDPAAWGSMLGILVNLSRPVPLVWALGRADDARRASALVGLRATVTAAGQDAAAGVDLLKAHIALGSDGCAQVSNVIFSNLGVSQRAALVFSVRGVEGPPVVLDLVTITDANPVSLNSIQNQIALPLFIMVPAFGANSISMALPARAACVALSVGGVLLMAGTSGLDFIATTLTYSTAYSREDVYFVVVLTGAWWLTLALVAIYLLFAVFPVTRAVCEVYVLPVCCRRRGRGPAAGSSGVFDTKAANASAGAGAGAGAAQGALDSADDASYDAARRDKAVRLDSSTFFARTILASRAYTRARLPRIVAPPQVALTAAELASDADGVRQRRGAAGRSSRAGAVSPSAFALKRAVSVFAPLPKEPAAPKKMQAGAGLGAKAKAAAAGVAAAAARSRARLSGSLFESSQDAFFFPQRLLISAAVAAIFMALAVELIWFAVGHVGTLAQQALDTLIETEGNAIRSVQGGIGLVLDQLTSSLSLAVDWASSQGIITQSFGSSVVSAAQLAIYKTLFRYALDAALQQAASGGGGGNSTSFGRFPAALTARFQQASAQALKSSSLVQSTEELVASVADLQRSIAQPWIDATMTSLRRSTAAGAGAAGLAVLLVWIHFFVTYKRIILSIRKGDLAAMPQTFRWAPARAAAGSVTTFIGIQSVGSTLTFLTLTLVFTGIVFVLQVQPVLLFVRDKVLAALGVAALVTIVLAQLRKAVMSKFATKGRDVQFRRIFAILDLYFSFINLVTGFAVAMMRFALFIPFYFILLMRPDIQSIPGDPACKSFESLVLLDSTFNNPVAKAGYEVFRRQLKAMRRRRRESARAAAAAAAAVAADKTDVRVQNPLAAAASGPAVVAADAAPRGPTASQRARSRWWLFAMLAAHPGLLPYRHREPGALAEGDDEDEDAAKQPSKGDPGGSVRTLTWAQQPQALKQECEREAVEAAAAAAPSTAAAAVAAAEAAAASMPAAEATAPAEAAQAFVAAGAEAADLPVSRWIECSDGTDVWYCDEAQTVTVWALPPGGVVVSVSSATQ